jgi:hypothetical protein
MFAVAFAGAQWHASLNNSFIHTSQKAQANFLHLLRVLGAAHLAHPAAVLPAVRAVCAAPATFGHFPSFLRHCIDKTRFVKRGFRQESNLRQPELPPGLLPN